MKKIKKNPLFREVTVMPQGEHKNFLKLVKKTKQTKSKTIRLAVIEACNKE